MAHTTSPSKLPRPLQELGPSERRRNSPSYNQATRKMIVSRESSPFDGSPRSSQSLWQKDTNSPGRLVAPTPDRDASPMPSAKRSSIENLKKASRVANSPMFARETKDKYDPSSSPLIERPLTDRPLSDRIQQNPFTRLDGNRKENHPFQTADSSARWRGESKTEAIPSPVSSVARTSPSKFSLLSKKPDAEPARDAENDTDQPSGLLRPMKSVTFESAPVITEYDQQTPEPSSIREDASDYSDAEDQSIDQETDDSFDASLEDATKTPIVMPGDWKSASPANARLDLVDQNDDVFDINAQSPVVPPSAAIRHKLRSESIASDESVRPLPAIPSASMTGPRESPSGTLRDRLNTLSMASSTNHDQDRVGDLPEFDHAPTISRESILRKVQSDKAHANGMDEYDDQLSLHSPVEMDYSELAQLDPDVPIPSRENSTHFDQLAAAAIKDEPEDSYVNLADIPALGSASMLNPLHDTASDRLSSVLHNNPYISESSASRYSESLHSTDDQNTASLQPHPTGLGIISNQDVFLTPSEEPSKQARELSLPLLSHQLNKDDLDLGMRDFITPSPPVEDMVVRENKSRREMSVVSPPPDQDQSSHALACDDETDDYEAQDLPHYELADTPTIPERKATIKTGGRLKARPSGTPGELELMLAAQRQQYDSDPVPDIPLQYRDPADIIDGESIQSHPSSAADSSTSKADSVTGQAMSRRNDKNMQLDLNLARSVSGAELGLAEEMDRIMDGQKRGYMMRQNTKVIVASNRNVSGSETQPARKASHGEKFISTEPWVGKPRRRSSRYSSGPRKPNMEPMTPSVGRESALGVLDEHMSQHDDEEDEVERGRLFVKVSGVKDLELPLPRSETLQFQLTLDNGLHCVTTADIDLGKTASIGQEFELVVLEDLEFQLTLTTNLPPPSRIVPSTLSGLSTSSRPKSPTKSLFSRLLSSPKKRAENERRARQEAEDAERQMQEERERQRAAAARDAPYERLRDLVDAKTGSFGRSYVSLKSHEQHCFGRQLTVDVPLYNEWALEKDANVVSSVRSKRSQGTMGQRDGVVRRPPYIIGNLVLQLLYIPKPKDARDTDMPKSMSNAVREMAAAEVLRASKHEGCLSQEGGDCRHWRRRFFKLNGTKLTAYHEHTRQPRATINLAKATRLIDDKTSLVADPNGGDATKRRKSAFAEQDDGYQFVEEGFRIRFANGETIDFYADDAAQKDTWMAVLSQCIGKQSPRSTARWTDIVLSQEQATTTVTDRKASDSLSQATTANGTGSVRKDSGGGGHGNGNTLTSRSVPSSPVKSHGWSDIHDFASVERNESKGKIRPGTPPLAPRNNHQKRKAVKSMIY